jgi:hypothetical protein
MMQIKKNISLLVIVFMVGLAIQVVLEWSGYSDSLGWWYTIYCAIVYTVPIFIILKASRWLYKKVKVVGSMGSDSIDH